MSLTISAGQSRYLLAVARHAIAVELGIASADPKPPAQLPAERCGAFVTLKIDGNLRGCIGTMTSTAPVEQVIPDMARSSAFSDPRFPPLSTEEFYRINIELSLLSPLERVASLSDIEPGTHGLLVKGRGKSGVLLPQVAREYRWDRTEFLEHTCRKAGLPANAYRDVRVELYCFTAVLCAEEKHEHHDSLD